MPEVLARLALVNKRVVYDLLFRAAAATLLAGRRQPEAPRRRHRRADGPAHVGATPAASSAHPLCRARRRSRHPMARGGSTRARRFFLPITVLRQVFRGKLVAGLREAFAQGRLHFPGALQPLATAVAFRAFLRSLYRQAWVVYAKPPFGSPAHVLHYLARYTHRVAISNHRLVAVTDDTVVVSLEGLSPREPDPHAHPRRRRIPPTLSAARPAEALCPDSLLRLPRAAVSHPRAGAVSAGPGRRSDARLRPTRPSSRPPRRTWPCPRCGAPDARGRTADRAPALPRGADRRAWSMTRRRPMRRPARRPQRRALARSPEVCAPATLRRDAPAHSQS